VRSDDIKSIEDYESFLSATVARWSPEQHVAMAAAMAERWLPAYEAFAAAEKWGDPASLRRILEAIWNHARGSTLAPAEQARQVTLLDDGTPHMDDFDAYQALAACVILGEALECCGSADSESAAVRAALSGFEAAVSDWASEPEDLPRLWKRAAARKELAKQLRLAERIGALTDLDAATVEALRRDLRSAELTGTVSKPRKPAAPPALTNQVAFEQYRRLLTSQLKRPASAAPSPSEPFFAMSIFCQWGLRYLHRLRTISGKHGQLADIVAQRALVDRHRARDAADPEVPDWGPLVRQIMQLNLRNPFSEYDVKSLDQPQGYGPSLRRLWADAKRMGFSDADAWRRITAWAHHSPAAWEAEDRRKKKGLACTTAELGEHLAQKLTWAATGDLDYPWAAEVGGMCWRVRLNDFPDDIKYTLMIGDEDGGSFHDWPRSWKRG
jgi:uncharacterized protein YjaG (DUF416 family)